MVRDLKQNFLKDSTPDVIRMSSYHPSTRGIGKVWTRMFERSRERHLAEANVIVVSVGGNTL